MFKYGFIMAGGLGRRLRPLTGAIPKPLLPVGDKPIIQFIIDHMKKHGIKHIFVSVNYKREVIKNYLKDGSRYGVKIEYVEEEDYTGTAGSLALLPKGFSHDLLVSNGDLITNIDYTEIYEKLKNFDLVITGIEKNVFVDFGVLDINDNSELLSWREKPNLKYIINGGIYGISSKVIDFIHKKVKKHTYLDMPSLWDMMKEGGMKIGVHIHNGEWRDIGRIEDYMALNEKGEIDK
ncbi:MAG: NTP transferase domain-containing protein [Thermotogaceae bacterium]|nr:NTP transferase domain-containing protein [Thermotogaceae bacterium]